MSENAARRLSLDRLLAGTIHAGAIEVDEDFPGFGTLTGADDPRRLRNRHATEQEPHPTQKTPP